MRYLSKNCKLDYRGSPLSAERIRSSDVDARWSTLDHRLSFLYDTHRRCVLPFLRKHSVLQCYHTRRDRPKDGEVGRWLKRPGVPFSQPKARFFTLGKPTTLYQKAVGVDG